MHWRSGNETNAIPPKPTPNLVLVITIKGRARLVLSLPQTTEFTLVVDMEAERVWENASVLAYSASAKLINGMRPLFYLERPSTSSFETVQEVPNYLDDVRLLIVSRSPTLLHQTSS